MEITKLTSGAKMTGIIRILTGAFISDNLEAALQNIGLLLLRVSVGGMMLVAHGWGKLTSYGVLSTKFPDPLGLGSTQLSLTLAVGAEVFCSILVIVGLATRFAAVPLVITMAVAAFIVHADDPWQKKEFALIYLLPFLSLVFTGAGRYSLDALLRRK